MTHPYEQFKTECAAEIQAMGQDLELKTATQSWIAQANAKKYSYHFEWLGRPIIQYPQDIIAMQEIIWQTKPDLIIETGIAHGGSLIFSASMLELNALCGGPAEATVIGIDIDIRPHNREAIEAHPMAKRIRLLQGSSVAPEIVQQVQAAAQGKQSILVCLDSNHTHEHVLAELNAYAPFVTVGNYCVVFDTIIEDLPAGMFPDRPWDIGNNPKTAVATYLAQNRHFQLDASIEQKLLITVAPGGYLKRVA
ncbi:cephalosporin hydroxylase family protein [Parvibium lacunae]|uniref:Cephalosporin hydroxylase n=1 Tax=Parvibium lacunae TaxID=1888893 RepID=A0A368L3S4_9BURK|nr:cephalosporin hydroxylase family protein [Parvibium lacunae]RCS58219.1 cephalosporin hydroxylase [Parvibium lacunae]